MYPGRTTLVLVRGIADVDPSADLSPFIDAANELVTEVCAPLGYSDHRLELIERWLSAHLYHVLDRRGEKVDLGSGAIGVSQSIRLDLGLDNTEYGQTAKRLDTKGALAIMENAQKKYAKVPAAILAGIKIGVTALGGGCCRRQRRIDYPNWPDSWGDP